MHGLLRDRQQWSIPLHGNSEAIRTMGRQDARERILEAAYNLFAHQGTRSVGVDAIIEKSGVAKMTLYRHFKSKQDLVLAFLRNPYDLEVSRYMDLRRSETEFADQQVVLAKRPT